MFRGRDAVQERSPLPVLLHRKYQAKASEAGFRLDHNTHTHTHTHTAAHKVNSNTYTHQSTHANNSKYAERLRE